MQIAKTDEESTSLQAGRDIHIYQGMSGQDVETLVTALISTKLPDITKDVTKAIKKNTKMFSDMLHKVISESDFNYDENKLNQPDVLFALSNAAQQAALKGEKIDLETLANLIEKRLQEDDEEMELHLETAIKSISQVSPRLIKALSVIFVIKSPLMVTQLQKNIEIARLIASHINDTVFSTGVTFKKSEMMGLLSKGLIFDNQKPLGIPEWGDRFDNYEPFDKILEKLKIEESELLKDVKLMYENFSNSGLYPYYLTIPGQFIAMIQLKPVAKFPNMNNFII